MQQNRNLAALDILRELFPKNSSVLLDALDEQAHWIRCKLKPISENCVTFFQEGNKKSIVNPQEAEDALRFLDFLDDYVWEHLNMGHWKNIPPRWRSLKSIVALLSVALRTLAALSGSEEELINCQDLIKICDQGLLMGSPLFLDNILAVLARRFHSLIAPLEESPQLCSPSLPTSTIGANVVQKSPTLVHLEGHSYEVPQTTNPSMEEFISYFKAEKPVLISGIIDNWPALKLWSPAYIVGIGGERTVPVEIGSKYTSEDWTQKLMTIREFVTQFMSETATASSDEADSEEQTNRKNLGYLAQYQLFDQLPELRNDILLPAFCLVGEEHEDNVEINAWFGPAHTLTPTHFDSKHNLLAQVFGTKFVRLFAPSEAANLYPHSADSLLFNTSQVDMEDPIVNERFPKVKSATYCDLYLCPGQVLYIPPKWWHAVQSLSPSFSVSFWFN